MKIIILSIQMAELENADISAFFSSRSIFFFGSENSRVSLCLRGGHAVAVNFTESVLSVLQMREAAMNSRYNHSFETMTVHYSRLSSTVTAFVHRKRLQTHDRFLSVLLKNCISM